MKIDNTIETRHTTKSTHNALNVNEKPIAISHGKDIHAISAPA